MEYTINRSKRIAIILCSLFLILQVIVKRLLLFVNPPAKIDIAEMLIKNAIYLIPLGYLMLVFYKYSRHYKLRILEIPILIIFAMECIFKSTLFTNTFGSTWKMAFLLSANAIWMIAIIVLIAGSFKNEAMAYPGMPLIRNYAISSLLVFIFVTIFPFYFSPGNPLAIQQLMELTSAIPYVFTVVFATKLKLQE